MKKSTHPRMRSMLSNMLQFRTWSMYDDLVGFLKYLISGAKKIFVVNPPQKGLHFEKVMKQKNVSEHALEVQQKALHRLSIILSLTGLIIFGYASYCILNGGVRQFFMSLALSAVAFSFAFRYHYYFYQLKTKQLGCSIRQWWRKGVLNLK